MIDSSDPYLQLAQAVVNKAIEDWAFYRIKTFWDYKLGFFVASQYAVDAYVFLKSDLMHMYEKAFGIDTNYILDSCEKIAHSGDKVKTYLDSHPDISPLAVAETMVRSLEHSLWAHLN